ncbi:MAG: amidohydrolase family protein [Cloacibacillus sp.]
MSYTIFKNATLIDGNGEDPKYNASVLIEDNIIKEVADNEIHCASADVIDCQGNALLPGLIDGHMHLGLIEIEVVDIVRRNPIGLIAARMFRNMRESLAMGYTSARDTGGADVGFRLAMENGEAVGPRLRVSGPCIAQSGGHGDNRGPSEYRPYYEGSMGFRSRLADGRAEVLKACRETLREGADFIKIMACGGCASPTGGPNACQYTPEEMSAAVEVAGNAGTYVAAHCYSDKSIRRCTEAGIRTIEHGNLLERQTAKMMAERGTYLVPTQITYEMVLEHARDTLSKFMYDKFIAVNDRGYEAIKIAMEEGVKIGGGSDLTGHNTQYAFGAITYQARAQGAMNAIVSFTKVNSEIMGISDQVGTIEAGKLADFIVVKGNPLENMELFKNSAENVLVIMQDGKTYKKLI